MRVLVLMRGAPGCGKSSYIKEHNLEAYALSADEIRLRIQAPVLMPNGLTGVSQKNDKEVWKILFNLLEMRMKKGEFTIIDATNSKTSEMTRYKELAATYKYRIYVIDMTDVPIEECKRRNAQRLPEYKRVPDTAIDKMYARFATQNVPSGIKAIKPDEFNTILYKPMDISEYTKIHIIGDIHGCNTALQDYLQGDLKEDQLYIFTGDYIDRGLESVEVLQFLISIYKRPNVILLEGNHEASLKSYAHCINDYTRNFRETTLPELNRAVSSGVIQLNDLRQVCRKFSQLCYFIYGDKKVLVTHGGLSGMKDDLIYISTEQIIRGVGEYEDYLICVKAFEENTNQNTYQVSGHRNIDKLPVHATDRCFNLEGGVERGGYLRVATLDKHGFETHEIKNNVFREEKAETPVEPSIREKLTNDDIINDLRLNRYVKERKMGDISSFNFTRDAFYKSKWNEQTTKARGLFVDTRDNSIAMRGYVKFFNINEILETKMEALKYNLQFPVTAYVKENGFLGLISYNKNTDDLIFATKSVVDYAAQEEDLVNVFKDLYMELTTEGQRQSLLNYVKEHNQTIVCECIHQQRDPHIIEYDHNVIYLLDIINNDFEFAKESYTTLCEIAPSFGLLYKEKACEFKDWTEFYTWYAEVTAENYQYHGRDIEGFVVEDNVGFMVKIKLDYYRFWKMMRGLTQETLKKGFISKTSQLYNAEANYYYGWLREYRDEYIYKDENDKTQFKDWNIIELRKKFLKDMENVHENK